MCMVIEAANFCANCGEVMDTLEVDLCEVCQAAEEFETMLILSRRILHKQASLDSARLERSVNHGTRIYDTASGL